MTATAQTSHPMSLTRAAIIAFVLEAALVAAVAITVANAAMKSSADEPLVITLSADTDSAPPTPPRPPVPRQVRRQPPRPHRTDPPPRPAPSDAATTPVPVAPRATAHAPASDPQPAIAPQVTPEIQASFRSLIRAAIQAAAHDPFAARIAHISGRVQVSFDYRDGHADNVKIMTSSGFRMIDQAARQAVLGADYPAPPANLAGRDLIFTMWVHIYQTDS